MTERARAAAELLKRLAILKCCNVDELWPPDLDKIALRWVTEALDDAVAQAVKERDTIIDGLRRTVETIRDEEARYHAEEIARLQSQLAQWKTRWFPQTTQEAIERAQKADEEIARLRAEIETLTDLLAEQETHSVAGAVAAERERCIKIMESWDIENDPDDLYTGRAHLVAALRAPGRQPWTGSAESENA